MVQGAIGAINPNQRIAVLVYSGKEVGESGQITPIYTTTYAIAQVQPIADQSLNQSQNVNQTGISRSFYLNGDFRSLNREQGDGGDIIIWNNQKWLVISVDEGWYATAGWTKVTATLQMPEQPERVPAVYCDNGTWFEAEELGTAQ